MKAKVKLIAINDSTRKFKSGVCEGVLLDKKVEGTISKDRFSDGAFQFSADKVEKTEKTIHLEGNAKLVYLEEEYFEADTIVLALN